MRRALIAIVVVAGFWAVVAGIIGLLIKFGIWGAAGMLSAALFVLVMAELKPDSNRTPEAEK